MVVLSGRGKKEKKKEKKKKKKDYLITCFNSELFRAQPCWLTLSLFLKKVRKALPREVCDAFVIPARRNIVYDVMFNLK